MYNFKEELKNTLPKIIEFLRQVESKAKKLFNVFKTKFKIVYKLYSTWIYIGVFTVIFPFILGQAYYYLNSKPRFIKSFNENDLIEARQKLVDEIKNIDKNLEAKTPRSYYLIINSVTNEFYLYKGKKLIKTDKCSTGSYVKLKGGVNQEWMFKTPKGEFKIKGKTDDPVWKKPDWAFVEEGLPVPSANHHSRFEYGVLGDYSLSLGDGYLIHGTLYQRFLGLPVTHGCIRLNDENLELIFNTLDYGSKVYIF